MEITKEEEKNSPDVSKMTDEERMIWELDQQMENMKK